MTKSNLRVFFGLFLLAFGFIMVFTSLTGMTGFFISENMSTSLNAILGLVPIAAGFMILFFGRGSDDNDKNDSYHDRMRDRDSLRRHNEQAHHKMRERYRTEHGHYPSKQELRAYMREHHETGELRDIMNDE